jgi:large subunit ribosomal protein L19
MNLASLIEVKKNPNIPELSPGDLVKVSIRILEGEKERIQAFQGVVIKIQRNASGGNFTVRRVVQGVGVERTFPLNSPLIEKVTVLRHGKVRRAKLYYLRGLSTKASRLKERRVEKELIGKELEKETAPTPAPEPEAEKSPEPEKEG